MIWQIPNIEIRLRVLALFFMDIVPIFIETLFPTKVFISLNAGLNIMALIILSSLPTWTDNFRKQVLTKSVSLKSMVPYTGCNARAPAATRFGRAMKPLLWILIICEQRVILDVAIVTKSPAPIF